MTGGTASMEPSRLKKMNMNPPNDNGNGAAPGNRKYLEEPSGAAARLERWVLRLIGQARRQYLCRLRPRHVERRRLDRRGECRQCGSCCDLTFRCPFLTMENRCNHYDRRMRTCRDFPIDALDLRLSRVPCGHYYESAAKESDHANSSG